MDPQSPKSIKQKNDRTLEIVWGDGDRNLYDVVALRRACPCASCIDEWTRQQILKPEQVSDTVRPKRIESVGAYALKIAFSDGHSTGIYTYRLLRDLA
jgi:DUF971 family protein